MRKIGIDNTTEAYIQSIVLKKLFKPFPLIIEGIICKKEKEERLRFVEALEEIAKSLELCDGDEFSDSNGKMMLLYFPQLINILVLLLLCTLFVFLKSSLPITNE